MELIKRIIFLLLCVQIGYSQEHIYRHFGVDEGLPSSEVYDIYQDKLGYIWFATDKGLSRYNGYEFENFTTEDGLPGNTILDFYPQKDGRVFCLEHHSNTLFYFNDVFDSFYTYAYNSLLKKHITSNAVVKSVVKDKNGTLIIGGYSFKGFIKISSQGVVTTHYTRDEIPEVTFPQRKPHLKIGLLSKENAFTTLYYDYNVEKQLITIPTAHKITSRLDVERLNDSTLVFIDNKLGVVSEYEKVTYYESEQYPIGIRGIDNNTFWVGYYSNGAEIRSTSGEVLETFLPNKSVSNFLIDAEGSYWFTTLDNGVYYIKNPEIKVFNNQHINSLVKDDNNVLYTGHHNGDISKINQLQSKILYKGLNDRPAHVEFSKKRGAVFGTSDYVMQNLTYKEPPILIYEARKLSEEILNPLVSVAANGYKIIANDSITYHKIGIRTEDACMYNNKVLIATPSGLFIDKEKGVSLFQNLPMLASRLYDIDIHKKTNNLYIASQGYGVIVYGDSIYNISKNEGLTNAIVSEVHIENDSTVWACTNTGLNRIIFKADKTFTINTITKDDGLLSNDINDIEIVNNTVWVATKNGLCYFNKGLMEAKEDLDILSLTLREVRVNNIKLEQQNISLEHHQNTIDFKVEAISNRNTSRINYFYRLKEIDSSWTKTNSRKISFPSLTPGNYTFEAKASVFGNPNNLITSYSFKIKPPFWKSWWFYSLCFFLFCAIVYLFFRIRVLTYNKDVFRELIRLAIKRLKRKELFFKFRANGGEFKIPTNDILYVNSQGNYLDIITKKKTYTIRCKIGDFISKTPDSLEYLRVHRSYIVRIDQVSSKGKNWVMVKDHKIPVGETYLSELDKIQF